MIDTPEKFWLRWKEPDASIPNELDRSVTQWFNKERLLEMIHDFLVFDAGVKKVCRPNQYFAVKAAQPRCEKKEGGVIWEAQGSGKSLIMVWLAEWIHENIDNSRVVIITDREELDEQILMVSRIPEKPLPVPRAVLVLSVCSMKRLLGCSVP